MYKSKILSVNQANAPQKVEPICMGGKAGVVRICVEKECSNNKNRLMCGSTKCQCNKKHYKCGQYINYEFVKKNMKDVEQSSQDFFVKVLNRLKFLIETSIDCYKQIQNKSTTFALIQSFKMIPRQINESRSISDQTCLNLDIYLRNNKWFEVPALLNNQDYTRRVNKVIQQCQNKFKQLAQYFKGLKDSIEKIDELSIKIITDHNTKIREQKEKRQKEEQ